MTPKAIVKAVSGAAIRALTRPIPKGLLFRSLLLLRRAYVRFGAAAPPLLRRWLDHLYYSMRPAVVDARMWDSKFLVCLNDPCHYDQLLGLHEPRVVSWLCQHVREGMVFCDIGANIGFYTLLAARRVGKAGRVVAVEADPGVAAVLLQTIKANGLENVHVVNAAAYRNPGTVRLGRAQASTWYSGLYYAQAVQWLDVPAVTLDWTTRECGVPRVDLVKIDVEGAEGDVLDGMARILREERPTILMEVHGLRAGGDTRSPIPKLKAAGYSIWDLDEAHIVAEPQGDGG